MSPADLSAAERHARAQASRARVQELRAKLRHAIRSRKDRMRELTMTIRAERLVLRDRLREQRKKTLLELREAAQAERVKARAVWLERRERAKREATSEIDQARAELAAARAHEDDRRRIDAAHRTDTARHARDARDQSDEQVRALVPRELHALFDRVKRSVRGSSSESRAEAFLRYAEKHPEPVLQTVAPKEDAQVKAAYEALKQAMRPARRKRVQTTLDLDSTLWAVAQKPPTPVNRATSDGGERAPARRKRKPEIPPGGILLEDFLRARRERAAAKTARAARKAERVGAAAGGQGTYAAPSHPSASPEDPASAAQKAAFEAKRLTRIQRLERKAARLGLEAERAHRGAKAISDRIPMGQPILVGHPSERRHRKDLAKIQRRYAKAATLTREAEGARRRAVAAAKNRAVSSDDPEALAKLRRRFEELSRDRERMRAANVAIRAGGDVAGALARLGFNAEAAAKLQIKDFAGRIGFADYQLANAGAEIGRLQKRITALAAKASAPKRADEQIGGARIGESANRVLVAFVDKPPPEVRQALKRGGFKWAPSLGVWQRHASEAAWHEARRILSKVPSPLGAS